MCLLSVRPCWVKLCSQLARSINHTEEGVSSKPFFGNKIIYLQLWHLLKSCTQKLTVILHLLLKILKAVNSYKREHSTDELPTNNSGFLLTLWLHRNQPLTVKSVYAADESLTFLGVAKMKHLPKPANMAHVKTNGSGTCTCTASDGWLQWGRKLATHTYIPGEAGLNADTQRYAG